MDSSLHMLSYHIIALPFVGKSSPGTIALRRVQRLAIISDPEYKQGRYELGKGPFAVRFTIHNVRLISLWF